jgi:hypothetical protein
MYSARNAAYYLAKLACKTLVVGSSDRVATKKPFGEDRVSGVGRGCSLTFGTSFWCEWLSVSA